MNVLEKIKEIRSEKRISQSDIAEYLGIAHNNYGRIERGEGELSVTRLFKIAEFLKVSPNELLGFEIPKLEERDEIGENENSNKIENLQKRIAELEDRIKDKNVIVDYMTNRLDIFTELVNDLISQYTYSKADEFGLLTFEGISKDGKKSTILKGIREKVTTQFHSKEFKIRECLASTDVREVIELCYNNDYITLYYIFTLGLMINSKIEEMQQIRIVFDSHLNDIETEDFNSKVAFKLNKYLDNFSHYAKELNDFGSKLK